MQRVAAREKETQEEEQKKRAVAGLPVGTPEDGIKRSTNVLSADLIPNNSRGGEQGLANGAERRDLEGDIPITSLDEKDCRNLVLSLTSPNIEKFTTFVDPYGFLDPLDVEFYEDIWYEHARRNTEIFRMVFHPQPDNRVTSWKDYKKFLKLQKAFVLAQQHESSRRRKQRPVNTDALLENSDVQHSDAGSVSDASIIKRDDGKRPTINFSKLNHDGGLLGDAPPSGDGSSAPNANGSKSKKKSLRRDKDDKPDPPAMNEEIDDGDMTGGESENESDIYESSEEMFHNANETPDNDALLFARRKKAPRLGAFARRRREVMGNRIFDRETAERILNEIQGHLVVFPTEWLSRELDGGNWFYNTDRLPPIEIYD